MGTPVAGAEPGRVTSDGAVSGTGPPDAARPAAGTPVAGIHIDHFVQIDFSGFKRMVDALGGVEICVDRPVNDPRD
ncbi:LCP family protein, partial [Actinomadura geliboluensis]|uniref:LCP family glycopolymer transferase n=1 Tax=Actinomadura geliboluensis TaxID=882440 RepID=UPI001486C964